jgi:hypothetical protein
MARIYYCYTCGEYFSIKRNVKINESSTICPHCEGDDTEHAPEEENGDDDIEYDPELEDRYDDAEDHNIDDDLIYEL